MKNIFSIFFLLISAATFSQDAKDLDMMMASTDSDKVNMFRKYYPNACYVYNSAEDYYKNNPIPKMQWHIWNSGSKIEVVRNGKTEKLKLSELGNVWYSDQNGLLIRNFQNTLYRVVVDGPVCYYVEVFNGEVEKETDSTFIFFPSQSSGKFFEFYSMSVKSDLKNGFDKMLEKYLKEYKLLDQYNSERVERNVQDSIWDVESRRINKKLKYLRIINSKLAAK
jgi:hypothetical protein